jgi:hypothetical protein
MSTKLLTLVFSHPGQSDEWPAMLERLGADTLIFHAGAEDETTRDGKVLAIKAQVGLPYRPETLIQVLRSVLMDEDFADYTHFLVVNGNVETVDRATIEAVGPLDYFGPYICDPQRGNRTWHMKMVPPTNPWAKQPYKGPMVAWCSGAHGYVLSRRAATIVNETALSVTIPLIRSHEIYDDLMVAKMLHGLAISPKKREIGVTFRASADGKTPTETKKTE